MSALRPTTPYPLDAAAWAVWAWGPPGGPRNGWLLIVYRDRDDLRTVVGPKTEPFRMTGSANPGGRVIGADTLEKRARRRAKRKEEAT